MTLLLHLVFMFTPAANLFTENFCAKVMNSIAKAMNSCANRTKSIAKRTNSIAKTCNEINDIDVHCCSADAIIVTQ